MPTAPHRRRLSIPALFAAQVARAPGCGGADLCWPFALTYRELDEAANQLAYLLVVQGVGPGDVCGAGAVVALGGGDRVDSWRC